MKNNKKKNEENKVQQQQQTTIQKLHVAILSIHKSLRNEQMKIKMMYDHYTAALDLLPRGQIGNIMLKYKTIYLQSTIVLHMNFVI